MNARRYFLGNTEFDGHSFDYVANPVTILKGRIVAVAIFVAWNIAAEISLPLFLVLLPVVGAIYPVFVNRGLRFDARMTVHRNVRFDFEGTYRRSLVVFVVLPAVAFLTLGLLAPFATRAAARYRADATRFGTLRFSANPRLGPLYRALWIAIAPVILGLIVMFGTFFLLLPTIYGDLLIALLPYGILLLIAFGYLLYRTAARNVVVNALVLDGRHEFRSDLRTSRIVDLTVTNLLAVVASAGLLIPWARIRMTRYTTERTGVVSDTPLGDVIDVESRRGNAAAAEGLELDGFGGIGGFGG